MAILGNRRLIAIDQDPLGAQADVGASSAGTMVFSKPLANGDRAVALCDSSDRPVTMRTSLAKVGLGAAGSATLVDAWTGVRSTTSGAITATVPAHGTVLFRVSVPR